MDPKLCLLLQNEYAMPCWLKSRKDGLNHIVMKNGIMDVQERIRLGDEYILNPLTPDLFTTMVLPYEYDRNASCKKWMKYLEEVQPNIENREHLQMLAGLSLVPDTSYNVFFILYGEGGTGKSVFLEVLQQLAGKENCCSVNLNAFGEKFGTAPLTQCLLNIVCELPSAGESKVMKSMEETLKKVTSGDIMSVEEKFKAGYTAKATARCIFATNELPVMLDKSNGIWDRLRIIPFQQVFRGTDKQNPLLKNELLEELPGILNWALEGLMKLKQRKCFPVCLEGENLVQAHRLTCDHEREFLLDEVELDFS